jgi:hypothetical protein
MRTITLTGLRNEVDMETGQPTCFELVFNKGALHIPVTQETMKQVVDYAFEGGAAPTPESVAEPDPPPLVDDDPQGVRDELAEDDDVPQF